MTHLGLQRIMIPGSQVSALTTGNISLAGAKGAFTIPWDGPEGSYDALASIKLSSTTASITFSGIPAGYKHLQVRALMNSTAASTQDAYMRFNGDSGSNYSYHAMYGDGSSIAAYGYASQTLAKMGVNAASIGSGTAFAGAITDIFDYSDVAKYKSIKTLCGFDTNAGSTNINNETVSISSSLWTSLSAITAIEIYPSGGSWAANSSFALYGVK